MQRLFYFIRNAVRISYLADGLGHPQRLHALGPTQNPLATQKPACAMYAHVQTGLFIS